MEGITVGGSAVVGIFVGLGTILAFMIKMWMSLNTKIDKKIDETNKKIDGVETKLTKKIDETNKRIDNLTEAFNSFSKTTDHRITTLEVEWRCLNNPKKIVVIEDHKSHEEIKEN